MISKKIFLRHDIECYKCSDSLAYASDCIVDEDQERILSDLFVRFTYWIACDKKVYKSDWHFDGESGTIPVIMHILIYEGGIAGSRPRKLSKQIIFIVSSKL